MDLSSPWGASVNDGISADEFTLNYVTVDQIIRSVSRLGKGALMAKFDLESAYRNVPVHPSYRYLLGMKWHNQYYVDLALPFGLRSAPFIFNVIADLVEWILVHSYQIPDLPHYLDDFIIYSWFLCLFFPYTAFFLLVSLKFLATLQFNHPIWAH